MRKLTAEDLQAIRIEEDMIKGNINRMCVTDSLTEIESMTHHAKRRIEAIRSINYKRLTEKEN